jgi:hypothetical protein
MGDVWAVLFMIGLLMQPLVVLGSLAYVIVVSVKIGHVTGRRDRVWKMTALHIAMVAGLGLGSEMVAEWGSASALLVSLATVLRAGSILAVPLTLRRRLVRLTSSPLDDHLPQEPPEEEQFDITDDLATTSADSSDVTSRHRTTATWTAWTIAVTGTLTPWVVGLGVKVYLDSQGRPTLPIADFVNPTALPVLVVVTLSMWSFPFLLLALAARYRILVRPHAGRSFAQRLCLVWLAYAGGMVAAVPLFVGVFWQFDIMYLIVPIGLYVLPVMALAYGAGLFMIRRGWIRA